LLVEVFKAVVDSEIFDDCPLEGEGPALQILAMSLSSWAV